MSNNMDDPLHLLAISTATQPLQQGIILWSNLPSHTLGIALDGHDEILFNTNLSNRPTELSKLQQGDVVKCKIVKTDDGDQIIDISTIGDDGNEEDFTIRRSPYESTSAIEMAHALGSDSEDEGDLPGYGGIHVIGNSLATTSFERSYSNAASYTSEDSNYSDSDIILLVYPENIAEGHDPSDTSSDPPLGFRHHRPSSTEMVFDKERFEGKVSDELICPICQGVLNDPLITPCEHLFCRHCINQCLDHRLECPVDRSRLSSMDLKPPQRPVKNMLDELKLKCTFTDHGCDQVLALKDIGSHEEAPVLIGAICPHRS